MQLRITSLVVALALSGLARAQQIDVAIAAAAGTGPTDCRYTDVQNYLMATGFFGSVDIVDVRASTPSLATLQSYAAIITWSNLDYFDSVAMGDVLADYVDAGGGVVVAVYSNTSTSTARYLRGRWQSGYEVIPAALGVTAGAASLGTVLDPAHPVMQGVNTFHGGTASNRPTTLSLTPGSSVIAQWSDGRTLVAEGPMPGRIDLGMYPPSSNCSAGFWTATTDGNLLVANALVYVAGGGVGTAFCFGDGSGSSCPCGNFGGAGEGCANSTASGAVIASTGSASVAAANLVLTGASLVPGQPGLYFQANQQVNGGLGNPFGDGLRCAGGGVRRLQVRQANGAGVSSTTIDLVAQGGVVAGNTHTYQIWYRDPTLGPCGSGFNLTNGLAITWQP